MFKQVIAIRTDLRLGKGKIAAQVAHASLESYLKTDKKTADAWRLAGAKKVVIQASSRKELIDLQTKAKKAALSYALIKDAGHTQVKPGTVTVLGIGPAKDELIDKLTGSFKLL